MQDDNYLKGLKFKYCLRLIIIYSANEKSRRKVFVGETENDLTDPSNFSGWSIDQAFDINL